ncbi:E3 ubiquitin-protein ligase hakai [Phtheirospermum japonicum]|uniref:RING-type E3 ubiquitin transferase n=1 Tax=Phtheirospermum japonicum TaxID=374723 RepID=A0A830BF70_9LAMI|nr:E3 ubiquitin-protein ligase hakai [Phtheirospermum japonicum]
MLQIRLSKPANETGASVKPVPVDTVTVACPDHLILADLPVAKCLGSPSATAVIKTVGRRSRRQLGERVHFCVRCDFPIAVYGRLSPCEHAFCLDCARSDSLCYLCDERVQKIQTIKMMEGIFICAAPHCLKSFLKKRDFESHIHEAHADLLNLTRENEVNESEAISARKPSASETTVQAPPKPVFSPHSNSQVLDREDKTQRQQNRDQPLLSRPVVQPMPVPPFSGQAPNHPSEQQTDGNQGHGFDRAAVQNRFPQQTFDSQGQGGPRQDSVNPNSVMARPQFGYPPYTPDGSQQFFGAPYEIPRPDSTPEPGQGQGSLVGYPPGPAGSMGFPPNYPQPWNMGPGTVPLEPPMVVVSQGTADGFMNVDPQGRGFFHGTNMGVEQRQGGNFVDPRDGKGVLTPQPLPLPPPPPPHLSQMQRGGRSFAGGDQDAPPGFGWPVERRDGFGGGQD